MNPVQGHRSDDLEELSNCISRILVLGCYVHTIPDKLEHDFNVGFDLFGMPCFNLCMDKKQSGYLKQILD